MKAAENEDMEMIKLLLENNAGLSGLNAHGHSALQMAFNTNNIEIARILVESGALKW
ncbi:MAG: ankyrin repeat domain-containing protein [Vulcanimicrobiota bacterium]